MDGTYYHVTTKSSIETIRKSGLIPQIGPRSRLAGEVFPYVYLFDDYGTMEDAAMNWLGDLFDDDEILVLCEIKLPENFSKNLFRQDPDSFEILCPVRIPQELITFKPL